MKNIFKFISVLTLAAVLTTCLFACSANNGKPSSKASSQAGGNLENSAPIKTDNGNYQFKDAVVEEMARKNLLNKEIIKNIDDPLTPELLKEVTNMFLDYTAGLDIGLVKTLEDLAMMPNIDSLNITGQSEITDISAVSACSNLWTLEASNTSINDISALASCPELRILHLYATNVTDLTPLAGNGNLQTLNASEAKVEKVDFSGMSSLKKVFLTKNNISDISTIGDAVNLSELLLEDNPITDISTLATCTLLKQIHIDNTLVTDVSVLLNCKELISIYMKNVNADYSMLENKEEMPNLLSITI